MKKIVSFLLLIFSSLFAESNIEILKKQIQKQSKTMQLLEKKLQF